MRISLSILSVLCLLLGARSTKGAVEPVPADVFDFGAICMGSSTTHVFVLKNEGSIPLDIASVDSACECLRVTSFPRRVEPRADGRIHVILEPTGAGAADFRVEVKAVGSEAPIRVFWMRGTILSGTGAKPRDTSCYLSAATVRQRLAGGNVVIVDVRQPSSFAAVHIPDSLNIPLFAVKTKSFLRGRDVILVDDGFGSGQVEETCAALRGIGLASAHVLSGGLNAWFHSGSTPARREAGTISVDEMPPAAFHEARQYDDLLVIDASMSPVEGLQPLSRNLVFIPFRGDDRDYASKVASVLKSRGGCERILIVTHSGEDHSAIRHVLADTDTPVFFLAGGLDTYEEYLRMITATGQGGTRTTVRETAVRTPPSRRSMAPSPKKKCGGCPG